MYDTRPAVKLLLKNEGGGVIARAARKIEPHLQHAHNVKAIAKGIHLK